MLSPGEWASHPLASADRQDIVLQGSDEDAVGAKWRHSWLLQPRLASQQVPEAGAVVEKMSKGSCLQDYWTLVSRFGRARHWAVGVRTIGDARV